MMHLCVEMVSVLLPCADPGGGPRGPWPPPPQNIAPPNSEAWAKRP